MKVLYKVIIVLIMITAINLVWNKLYAQLSPFGSAYFQNRYINNPAYAGLNKGFDLAGAFKQQFSSLPGTPQMQSVTIENGFDEKSGLGMKFYNDKAGVLRYTTLSLTYAYHLQLDDSDKKLNFGLSAGISDYNIDLDRIKGDQGDIDVISVAQRKTYFDGDFGIAYTSKTLALEAAIPNMKQVFKRDLNNNNDFAVFYSAASYRIETNFGSMEPRVAFRAIHGYKNIVDGGLNVEFLPAEGRQPLNLFGIYHSTKSFTGGAGVKITPNFGLNVMYTTSTSDLQGYSNGDFEIGIKVSPFAKRGQ